MLANEQKTRPNKNNYLAYLIANNMFHGATALTEPDKDKPKPKSNFSLLRNLRILFGDRQNKSKNLPLWVDNRLIEKYSQNGKYRDPLELFAEYEKLHNKVERLQRFAKSRDKCYLLDIIASRIASIKQKFAVRTDVTYEWRRSIHVWGFMPNAMEWIWNLGIFFWMSFRI